MENAMYQVGSEHRRNVSFLEKITEFEERRSTSAALPKGSGPYTASTSFRAKSIVCQNQAKGWQHRFSEESRSQVASELKIASRGNGPPSKVPRISLGTGRPATQYFPWSSIVMNSIDFGGNIDRSRTMSCFKGDDAYDLDIAMNYGYSAGSPQVLRFITEHVELIHNPPYRDWECCVTCGSTSALEIALRLFSTRGDWLLTEQYTYPGTVSTAKLLGLNILGISVDALGLCPKDLDHQLQTWDDSRGRKPFVLYMIPCGQNPTGTTQSKQRRQDIYHVAEKHDLLIFEDDPYFFLSLGDLSQDQTMNDSGSMTIEEYLSRLPPSYLSLDVSGRVLRIDTTSKFLAPGLRFGWITASSQIIEKFVFHSEASVLAPSGPSQLMVYKLLDQTWGHTGLIRWLIYLCSEYRERRDVLAKACQEYLSGKACRWTVPVTGMFLWIQLTGMTQTAGQMCNVCTEEEDRIYRAASENGVLVSKGSWFAAVSGALDSISFRLSFATASHNELRQGVERLASIIATRYSIN